MSKIDTIMNGVTQLAGNSGLQFKKFLPDILMGVGVIGVVGTVVVASRATLKLETKVDKIHADLQELSDFRDNSAVTDYADNAYGKDVAKIYIRSAIDLGKLYAPALALGMVSIVCLVSSHGIMKQRNAALTVAYVAVERAYNAYRARVTEEYGPEKDLDFHRGRRDVTLVEKDEESGKKIKIPVKEIDSNTHTPYAKFFDDTCGSWQRNAEYNLMFLVGQQNYMNDMLHARGHVFLNEVYDRLGIPRTREGALVGWIMKKGGPNSIDFGIYDANNTRAREFVNGYEYSILLDFNVDGPIHNLI